MEEAGGKRKGIRIFFGGNSMKTIQKAIKKRWFFRNNVVNKSRTIGARNGDGYGKK